MPKTAKKNFNDKLRAEIWGLFLQEIKKGRSPVDTADCLRKFLTESEIAILEKRLAVLYFLSRGESLRRTSEKSGLVKKVVISVKHGFREPIHRPPGKIQYRENKFEPRFAESLYSNLNTRIRRRR